MPITEIRPDAQAVTDNTAQTDRSPALPAENDCVRLAVDYITAHYDQPIPVPELAKYASVSHSSLYRGFLARYGVPPKQFLLEFRISRACALMETTDRPIGEIAAAVGFDDAFYFSRIFKKLRGIPPRAYAAMHRPHDPSDT